MFEIPGGVNTWFLWTPAGGVDIWFLWRFVNGIYVCKRSEKYVQLKNGVMEINKYEMWKKNRKQFTN